jgi:valyl-tRNA synthetase
MLGDPTLYLPGTDHAGIETQFVFEKKLKKEGKSRLDFDRETLYRMIHDFVEENRGVATNQLKKLGFSLDWSREKYTLSDEVLAIVYATFHQLHQDGLLYRAERLVNYCTHCGTGYSNLEVHHEERTDSIYYLDYGPIHIATTRPETIYGDVAVAVNPNDPRYQKLIGQTAIVPLINKKIPIIADEAVESAFGTGALKITPAHDPVDYEVGERHHLPSISVINRQGKMINVPDDLLGMRAKKAREMTIEKLQAMGTLIKTEPIIHAVSVCYKCSNAIEPLLIPQWYIRVATLVDAVVKAVENAEVKIYPARYKDELLRWLNTMPDWNISRQIVWGPRMQVWYCTECNPNLEVTFLDPKTRTIVHGPYSEMTTTHSFTEIQDNLQNLVASVDATYQLDSAACQKCHQHNLLQETDTFDTWFSSGQWPLSTLGYPDSEDFKYFYPTTLMDTMWDILPFWVMRMLMLGIYRTDKSPFEWVHLHARVVDSKGQKMSKSRGNVINPMELVDKYGADVLRMVLVFGVAPAADIALGDEKLIGMRNFMTKIWNVARFILMNEDKFKARGTTKVKLQEPDRAIIEKLNLTIQTVTESLEKFQFSLASEAIYDFIWNKLASEYLESTKGRDDEAVTWTLFTVLRESLKLLHPIMPFVTEEIYQKLPNKDAKYLAIAPWPKPISIDF